MNIHRLRNQLIATRSLASRISKSFGHRQRRDDRHFSREFFEFDDVVPSATKSASVPIQPAVFIHGVAPRSGTNYLNALLAKHPDLDSCPGDIFEFPFLTHIDQFQDYQNVVLNDYPRNRENINEADLFQQYGESLVRYIYLRSEQGKTPLVKEPSVRNLRYFHHVFPGQKLLLLIRDGRDVVQSTISSWPGWTIRNAAIRWARSAELMLEYNRRFQEDRGCLLTRYEDLVESLQPEMARVCDYLEISDDIYQGDIDDSIRIIGSSTHSREEGKVTWKAIEKTKDFKHKQKWATWTERERSTFKKVAGDVLIQAGYADDHQW